MLRLDRARTMAAAKKPEAEAPKFFRPRLFFCGQSRSRQLGEFHLDGFLVRAPFDLYLDLDLVIFKAKG